jgi:hypothetical protein
MKKLLILLLLVISICGYATVASACGPYCQPHRRHHYIAPPYRHHHYVAPPYRRHYYRPHRRYFNRYDSGNQVRIRVGDKNASLRMRLNFN